MDTHKDETLYRRVEKLESAVRELQTRIDGGERPVSSHRRQRASTAGTTQDRGSTVEPRAQAHTNRKRAQARSSEGLADRLKPLIAANSETLLNKIGIALLLLGVAFLFKYSIDQGWITETIRILFGVVLASYLLITGVRIASRRPLLAPVLNGGGIAVLYGTIYVAFALYGMIGAAAAFYYMLGVTVLAFLISVYQNEVPLSVIATVGGLATPFLVPAEDPSMIGLAIYASFILAGTTATYMYRGWRLPMFTAALGGWLVLAVGYLQIDYARDVTQFEQLAFYGATYAYWILIGLCPTARDVLHLRAPERWPSSTAAAIDFLSRPALILSVTTPLIVLALATMDPAVPNWVWGWVAIATAFGYGAASGYLAAQPQDEIRSLVQSHRLAAAILFTVGLVSIYTGPWLVLMISIEAAVLILIASRLGDSILNGTGVILFTIAVMFILQQMSVRPDELAPVINAQSLAQFASIVVLGISAYVFVKGANRRSALAGVHILFLLWMLTELGALPDGQAFVTVAWGSYAVTLFLLGFRFHSDDVRTAGLLTLLLAVGKLLIVDLAAVDPVWRILLFLGFGGGLLLLSYYVPDLWRSAAPSAEDAEVVTTAP